MKIYKNTGEYIKNAPKETAPKLKEMRSLVQKLVPKGKEVIAYGMPTIKLGDKNFLHFAAMKGHLGFYPTPSGIRPFEKELIQKGISFSKGCIRFPYDKPLPISLIKKIITFRLREGKQHK